MNDQTDQQLLRAYSEHQSEAAFAAIVHRYVDLVYSAALRLSCDTHAAKDVTQSVFVALAQNAPQLTNRPALVGWLHGTARNLAVKAIRSEVRRRAREQEAAVMNELLSANPDLSRRSEAETDASWEHIAPHLDEALGELSEPDREAVLLRYFKNHDLRTVGTTLGISDDAAQKRVSRAVERLREFFAKRGVTVGAGGLAAVIAANAVQAAPVGLALAISTAAALTGTTLATTATVTATKAIAMTMLQKTLITATVGILAIAGIYETRQASALRGEVQSLRQAQAPLLEQVAQLKSENERLSSRSKQSSALSQQQFYELLRLRGRAGASAQELAELKTALAQQPGKVPEIVTRELNAFLSSITNQGRQVFTNVALRRVRHMAANANLTAAQQEAIRDILLANVEARAVMEVARFSGDSPLDEIMSRKEKLDEDEDRRLGEVLSPDQLAEYRRMKADDVQSDNRAWINSESAFMKRRVKLSDQQAEQVSAILSNLKPGEGGPGITYYSTARNQLETRLAALETVLTPQQLQAYREMKLDDIEEHERLPQIIQALKK